MSKHLSLPLSGFTTPGYEPVADAFAANFSDRGEVGAAFAAYVDGRLVVDLWGGHADRERRTPWHQDTLQVVFSGTKGLVAVCLLLLLERGALELDAPVAEYWPEFAAADKGGVLVRQLVSHQAGLPGIRTPIGYDELVDDRLMAALLAEQEPFWAPGERVAYHPLTFGWLCGELIRRADGRSVGRVFAEDVAQPLGLAAWIGLPAEHEPRVATLHHGEAWGRLPVFDASRAETDPVFAAIWNNPAGRHGEAIPWNRRALHAAEIPGAGGIATARALARLYGCLACGGELDGVRLLSERTIALGRSCLARGIDPYLETPLAVGIGFQLQEAERMAPGDPRGFGPADAAFGHGGSGGSMHGAWPAERVGFSYAMNEMRDDLVDARSQSLLEALWTARRRASPRRG